MAVFRRGKIWWVEFLYQGQRIRESAKTSRKTIAEEYERKRHLELERASAGLPSIGSKQRIRRVCEALSDYSKGYVLNHREKSILMVKQRSAHLLRLLGPVMLSDLTDQRVTAYMEKRLEEGVGGRTINLELQILSCAMGYTWKALWPRVKKLHENHDIGKAFETYQEKAILEVAARNQSRLIYPFLFTLALDGDAKR